jgi:hypothetical protein
VIQIKLSRIPAKGTSDPWEVASATLDGIAYSQRSRSTSIAKLARAIVEAGVQDQPWSAVSPNGTVALRGRSLHAIARTTITESDREGLRQRIWHPHPAGQRKEGAEEPRSINDTSQDAEAAQRSTSRAQMGV